ncbi:MAG TPA: hypothetical protein VFP97_01290 [Chitinophagaceae bacterium]|nr:hypothetical protein [Chitinophagaceae bacterium]
MMKPFIGQVTLVLALFSATYVSNGQGNSTRNTEISSAAKPFKVLTNGRQFTIQSRQNLRSLMVWTSSGHRIVEEKGLKTNSYSFTVPAKEKVIFMMIETAEGKRFTEKMGVK